MGFDADRDVSAELGDRLDQPIRRNLGDLTGKELGEARLGNADELPEGRLAEPHLAAVAVKDTDEFGLVSPDGVIYSYYKPDPAEHGYDTNLEYFNAQYR
jgi:hypothetical protein